MPGATHLDALTIRGFRGIEHAEFDKLGQINVIAGRNDVGKTSVLEAVFLTTGFAVPRLSVAVQNQRRHLVADSHDLLLLFHGQNVARPIDFVASTSDHTRRLTISAEQADVVIDQNVRSSSQGDYGDGALAPAAGYLSKPDAPHVLRYRATLEPRCSGERKTYAGRLSVTNGVIKATDSPGGAALRDQTIPARMLTPDLACDSQTISALLVSKKHEMFIECLQAINPQVTGITVSGDVAYVDLGFDRMVPFSMCGGGLVRAAQVLSWCILGDVRILLIDEIGYGIHYSAMEPFLTSVMTTCEQQDIQVFLTTHSLGVLQSLYRVLSGGLSDFQSKIGYYNLARDKDGRVRTYRYDYEQFEHTVSHGIEIR